MLRYLRPRSRNFYSVAPHMGNVTPKPRRVSDLSAANPERVKVRRKWFKPLAALGTVAVYYTCYQIYVNNMLGVLSRAVDKLPEPTKQEREELERPFFVPLPFTIEEVPAKAYKATDPEWQEFAKISRDKSLQSALLSQLAELARSAVEHHPTLNRDIGKEVTVKKAWLEIQYPRKPHPTFEWKGIELAAQGIAVVTQPVDSAVVFRLRRTLWPSSIGLSVWSYTTTLMKQNLLGTAKNLGYDPKPQSPTINVQQAMEKFQPATKEQDAKERSALPPKQNSGTGDGAATGASSYVEKPGTENEPSPVREPNYPKDRPKSMREVFGVAQMSQHTGQGPWQALRTRLAQTWKPKPPYPARGCIIVDGVLEIGGPRGSVILDVRSYWDPKSKRWDYPNTFLAVRNVKLKAVVPAKR